MTSVLQLLTLEEFHARYDGIKPYFEYWNGEPVQKAMPKWLHSLIQGSIRDLLKENGYKAGVEIELRIDENWQPVPDVIGATRIEQPYPTQPVEIVVEVLSLDDQMSRVIQKCRIYSAIGIKNILIIDPEHRSGLEWKSAASQLVVVESVVLPNGRVLELTELWKRLDLELQ